MISHVVFQFVFLTKVNELVLLIRVMYCKTCLLDGV